MKQILLNKSTFDRLELKQKFYFLDIKFLIVKCYQFRRI